MEKTQVRRGWRFSSATLASIIFLVVYAGNFAVHGVTADEGVDDSQPILESPLVKTANGTT